MKTSLIKIEKGAKVAHYNRFSSVGELPETVVVEDFILVPNGINDSTLVCLIYARRENGNLIEATSEKFYALDEVAYETFYPSAHFLKLNSHESSSNKS